MDYKRSKAPTNTVTHNLMDFCEGTNNIYESVVIMSKRANQISVKMKEFGGDFWKPWADWNLSLLWKAAEANVDCCRRIPSWQNLLP